MKRQKTGPSNPGYIYLRTNEYWDLYDAYKLGKTDNAMDREASYITAEIRRGAYVMILQIDAHVDQVERQLQTHFNQLNLHVQFNAGTEFYKKDILRLIVPYLDSTGVVYRVLTQAEMDGLIRTVRDTVTTVEDEKEEEKEEEDEKEKEEERIIIPTSFFKHKTIQLTPRDYQEILIGKSVAHFQTHNKGLLIIPCGAGKTLISLWIAQQLDATTVLIGVPNKLLLKQWEETAKHVFPGVPLLSVSSGVSTEQISHFLTIYGSRCIVFTTYASAHKVYTAANTTRYVFRMKINDEAHHLTTIHMQLEHTAKKYVQMLHIPSEIQLSLTATVKLLEIDQPMEEDDEDGKDGKDGKDGDKKEKQRVVSNDDVAHFGEIIDKRGVLWAIEKSIICDYVIQTIVTNEDQLDQQLSRFSLTEDTHKRLFLSAYASLKSIANRNSHHLLIYANNKENSQLLIHFMAKLLEYHYFDIPELYLSSYHSEMRPKEQHDIKKNFNKAPFGIITCVYCLSEGYDNPRIDAVVFAENMSSEIRIVQSALRASRKNKGEPEKITKIILPILMKDDWLENRNNPDLQKVTKVIYQMGLEDETIPQKIKAYRIDLVTTTTITASRKERQPEATLLTDLGEYDDDLTQQIKLKTIRRTTLGISYEKAKKILADKHLRGKTSYYELCERDNRLTKEPEIVFREKFDWIDYLHIDRTKYYDLETCQRKIRAYLALHPELTTHHCLDLTRVCTQLCELDERFPPEGLWCEFYRVKNLMDIIVIFVSSGITQLDGVL